MRKKKDEPREIPIEYFEGDEAEQETDDQPQENEQTGDEPPAVYMDATDVEDSGPAAGDKVDSSASLEDMRKGLQAQIDTLTQEKSALYDQALRRQAEFENFRRRTERERTELHQRARADVLMELLPVIDNYERALSSLEKSGEDAAALRQGVELIHKQFNDALTKLGLQPVDAVGQAFDPHVHEAVTIEPTDQHEENTVIEEFQRGYKLGDRLLRPAKVKVASSPNE